LPDYYDFKKSNIEVHQTAMESFGKGWRVEQKKCCRECSRKCGEALWSSNEPFNHSTCVGCTRE